MNMIEHKKSLIHYKELMKEWDWIENNKEGLDPNILTAGSGEKAHWCCSNGHKWQAVIQYRTKGGNCPYCSNKKTLIGFNDLATTHPQVASEWDFTKNKNLLPTQVVAGSNKEIWWKCSQGHSYRCRIIHRTFDGTRCPYCTNKKLLVGFNDLKTVHPELCVDWDYEKNYPKIPKNFITGSAKKVYWKCHNCNHEWSATIDARCQGGGCPKCATQKRIKSYKKTKITQNGSLQNNNPKLAAQWNFDKNGELTPDDVASCSSDNVWWKCEKGHEWKASINNRSKGKGCPYCNMERQTSIPEQIIHYYLSSLFNVKNKYLFDDKYEIDIYIPSLKIGIEYNGLYWHNIHGRECIDNKKETYLKNNGVKLITIKEAEYYNKTNDVIFYKYSYNYYTMKQVILDIIDIISSVTNIHYMIDVNIDRDITSIIELLNLQSKNNSILIKCPSIKDFWDYDKNKIFPDQISYGSQKPIYLKCKNGHSWKSTPNNFYRRPYCTYCRGTNLYGKRNKAYTIQND